VRIVLAEKKIDYEFVIDSPWLGDSKVPDVNPLGKIPVLLLDDETPLFDSRVIVEYIDNVTPNNKLFPAPNRERTEVKRWEALAAGICDAAVSAFLEAKRPAGLQSGDWILRQRVDVLVVALGGNDGLRGIDPAVTRANLQAIIDRARAKQLKPDEIGGGTRPWESGALPPIAELIAWGELASSASRRTRGPRIDEIGTAFAAKVVDVVAGRRRPSPGPRPADRRRAIESAHWIEANAAQDIDLQSLAQRARLSVYHYLRVFSSVVGATPHQYLLRCRLRHAARLLADEDRSVTDIALDVGYADLSNFVRSFTRAAGVSPRAYRRASRGDRKILQDRLEATA